VTGSAAQSGCPAPCLKHGQGPWLQVLHVLLSCCPAHALPSPLWPYQQPGQLRVAHSRDTIGLSVCARPCDGAPCSLQFQSRTCSGVDSDLDSNADFSPVRVAMRPAMCVPSCWAAWTPPLAAVCPRAEAAVCSPTRLATASPTLSTTLSPILSVILSLTRSPALWATLSPTLSATLSPSLSVRRSPA
jgi:hypothetical protein